MDEEKEEWDGPWKEALDSLALVFELFWPDAPGEVDLAKAVAVVSGVTITHPRPVSKADLANVIGQAYGGAPPRF